MPEFMVCICFLKRPCTQSLNIKREINMASVAPMVLANETATVPVSKPKKAPPPKVIQTAPGSENAVMTM